MNRTPTQTARRSTAGLKSNAPSTGLNTTTPIKAGFNRRRPIAWRLQPQAPIHQRQPHIHANRPAVNRRAKKQRPVNGAEHDNTNQSRF
jgi:hypothetical protein